MRQGSFRIIENRMIAARTYQLVLKGDALYDVRPGQFVEVKIDPYYLRRPISVCDVEENRLTLIYKTVGKGTASLSEMKDGDLDLLLPLGNGYDLTKAGDAPLLIGGGVGVPPLYCLAKELRKQNKDVSVILGFNSKNEIFYEDEFRKLGCDVTVTTVDGSYGTKGFVTDAMNQNYTYFYSYGPLPMLKAVNKAASTSGQFSLEERMGCGFGACMGCAIQTRKGNKRVCKDGPVFEKEDILWED